MSFNPFKEKGIPIEKQFLNWDKLNIQPYDKNSVHPYTRTRIILMNGIEVEGAIFGHQFARHTVEPELKQKISMSRRVEQEQQKMVNGLVPGDESSIEVTLGYEQVAVDLTAWLARTEPDPDVKAALDFALIEDFDHLYRYANLLELLENKDPADIVGDLTEVFPGRPTKLEHRHPIDSIRTPYSSARAQPLTKLHVATIVAGEQQTMNYYMNTANRFDNELARGLYLEIAQIEEQHASHYESLADPTMSWFDRLVLHEYNECYMYYSCMESETDPRIKSFWEMNLSFELEHLRIAAELQKQYERKDPTADYGTGFPELTVFQSNKDYVRKVLATQIDLTESGSSLVPVDELPAEAPYHIFQRMVNEDTMVPSEEVIEQNARANGREYRIESEGPHPIEWLRAPEEALR